MNFQYQIQQSFAGNLSKLLTALQNKTHVGPDSLDIVYTRRLGNVHVREQNTHGVVDTVRHKVGVRLQMVSIRGAVLKFTGVQFLPNVTQGL